MQPLPASSVEEIFSGLKMKSLSAIWSALTAIAPELTSEQWKQENERRSGECKYCDAYPEVQQYRIDNNIAFTGHMALGIKPCPADADRPPGSPSDHRRWGGNKPTSAQGDPSWPVETFSSRVMYGDMGGREEWPPLEMLRRRLWQPLNDLGRWLSGWEKWHGMWSYKTGSKPPLGKTGARVGRWLYQRRML